MGDFKTKTLRFAVCSVNDFFFLPTSHLKAFQKDLTRFLKCLGFRCPFIFHQFIVNNYNFFQTLLSLLYIIAENYMLQLLFFTVFLFVVRFSLGFFWRRLMLSVLLFRLTASSCSGFPYSPFSSNALSSGAIAEPSPVQTSKSKLLYIQKDPLDGAASFFPLTVLQIKDLPR